MNKELKKPFINFLGIGITPITYAGVYRLIDNWIKDKGSRSHHIACLNAYCIALAFGNERLRNIYNSADLSGADGMPFVYWIRAFHKFKCDRIAGPDLILKLAEHSKITKYSFYLYGGAPDVCQNMYDYLKSRYPHINIVGHYSPPFRELTPGENTKIIVDINRLKPDIIFVGLGTPKQDYWIDENLIHIKGSVLIATGAAFDFLGGRIKMAPQFIRVSGLEWIHRLFSKDFKRLWKRYTIMHGLFLWHGILQITKVRKYPVNAISRDK